ncbi:MAG: hypothetical protein E7557_02225 [Ruminococcaceae bacterium]|nr:hypothetical protein [Oscillospiraceae bacterium]
MKIISVIVILSLLFISGCTASVNNETTTKSEAENTTVSNDYNMVFSDKITFYRISRDNFEMFLNEPLHSFLKNNCSNEATLNSSGVYTRGSALFRVNKEQFEFLSNENNLSNYLSENGIFGTIKNTAILDVPKAPIIIWIETDTENIFVTVDEKAEEKLDEEYTLSLYSNQEFCNKFKKRDGKLVVLGKEINSDFTPQIYNDYADVSFIEVINALNVKTEVKNNLIYIHTKNDVYILNEEECLLYKKSDRNKTNLLHLISGDYYFVYSSNGKLIVDSEVLVSTLYGIGIKISGKVDSENNTVNINLR